MPHSFDALVLFKELKSLIVYINYALLGFYLCHFRRDENITRFNSVKLKYINIKRYILFSI